jgi:hypothetical protein
LISNVSTRNILSLGRLLVSGLRKSGDRIPSRVQHAGSHEFGSRCRVTIVRKVGECSVDIFERIGPGQATALNDLGHSIIGNKIDGLPGREQFVKFVACYFRTPDRRAGPRGAMPPRPAGRSIRFPHDRCGRGSTRIGLYAYRRGPASCPRDRHSRPDFCRF